LSEWIPISALPNLLLREPVGDGDIAVTPRSDNRIAAAVAEQPLIGEFLDRFTDAFGRPILPSVLIIRQDVIEAYGNTSAMAGFRDLLAVATIPNARAVYITHGGGMGAPVWSETFSIYPWMVDRHGKELVCQTPAMLGTHHVEEFRGQTDVGLPQHQVEPSRVDGPLFSEVLLRWHRRFSGDEASWEDRALFRSLNMARAAMLMPGGVEFNFYDVGRLLTLWISAFEILHHPGPGGGIGEAQILDVLDRANWLDQRCADLAAEVKIGKHTTARTAASELCHRIYALRNDFLHGNDVRGEQLVINKVPFLLLASSLYRVVLATFLNLRAPPNKDDADAEAIAHYIGTLTYWREPQRRHERAILKAAGIGKIDG
jgi:hypothetical protein